VFIRLPNEIFVAFISSGCPNFKKDGTTRGASACAARATSTNIQV
jgi:hypothetical protein